MAHTHHRARRLVVAVLAATAIVAGACSSDDSAGDDETSPDTTIDTAILGEKNPASGDPIQIGFVYDGVSDAVDNTEELVAAEAARDYVNEYMAGIDGRPIELVVCSTDQTPAGASDCVTEFANAGVPVVLNGVTGQAGSLFEPLEEAGIAVFVTAANPTDPGADIMTNGTLSLAAGPAKVFADEGIEAAAIIGIDVPAASAALKTSAALFYEEAGVEPDVVLIPPDTPDMSPNIQAAISKNPGGMTVVGDALFCTKAMQAIAAAGYDGKLVIIPQCIDENFLEQTTNLEGATMLTTSTSDPDSEEYKLYSAVMHTYAGADANLGGTAPQAYQAVLGFARAMDGVTGEITVDVVRSQLASMPPTPMPLGDGIMFQCDGKQVALTPAICSQDVLQTVLDADGNPGEFSILKGSEILATG